MSLEAVKMVTEAEQSAKERKVQAALEAKKLIAEAEKAGKHTVFEAKQDAKAQVAEMLSRAEHDAVAQMSAAVKDTEAICDQLRASAQKKLDKAAEQIVRKVVDA